MGRKGEIRSEGVGKEGLVKGRGGGGGGRGELRGKGGRE